MFIFAKDPEVFNGCRDLDVEEGVTSLFSLVPSLPALHAIIMEVRRTLQPQGVAGDVLHLGLPPISQGT